MWYCPTKCILLRTWPLERMFCCCYFSKIISSTTDSCQPQLGAETLSSTNPFITFVLYFCVFYLPCPSPCKTDEKNQFQLLLICLVPKLGKWCWTQVGNGGDVPQRKLFLGQKWDWVNAPLQKPWPAANWSILDKRICLRAHWSEGKDSQEVRLLQSHLSTSGSGVQSLFKSLKKVWTELPRLQCLQVLSLCTLGPQCGFWGSELTFLLMQINSTELN